MDFEFSADQELLRGSVRRFLADRAPITPYVRDAYDASVVHPDDVWAGLRDLGVVGLLAPETHGGSGMAMVDAAVVLEELGRAVCPAPYLASAIGAVTLVLEAGTAKEHAVLLPGLANGSTVGTVAVHESRRRYTWTNPTTRARPAGDGWTIDGEKVHVPDAGAAGLVLVTALDDSDTLGVFAVETARGPAGNRVHVTPTPSVDGSRKQARVTFDDAPARRLGSGDASSAVARTLDAMTVAYVVDGVGAASRALELVIEYAKERVQFDRPIGSFQAVQHLCADMLRVVELGRAAAYYACWAADDADRAEAHRAATLAGAYASEAFAALGGSAIQVFGGIGFTWEHDIHLFYKRLLTCATATGGTDEHLAALADIVIG